MNPHQSGGTQSDVAYDGILGTQGSAEAGATDTGATVATLAEVWLHRAIWQRQAACRWLPTELFFPTGNSDIARTDEARAKEVCVTCPVRAECLDLALTNEEPYGVWGGLTVTERRALMAEQRHRAR